MSSNVFAPFHEFLQLAYVTTDLERALEEFRDKYGIAEWMVLAGTEMQTAGDRSLVANVAMAYVGATQLELIEPVSGDESIYRDPLPKNGFGIRFHHTAQLMKTKEELKETERQVRDAQVPIGMKGSYGGGLVCYFYSDHRSTLGHYIEHIWYAPEMNDFLAQIPRN